MNDQEFPSSAYIRKTMEHNRARQHNVFDEYKEIIKDETHPDNQSPAYKEKIRKTLQRLLTVANEVDMVNETAGEGIFGLMALALRSIVLVKDENVKLKKELDDLKKQVRRLEKQSTK